MSIYLDNEDNLSRREYIRKPPYLHAICLALEQSLLSNFRIINQPVSGNTLPSGNPLPCLTVPPVLEFVFDYSDKL